MRPKPCRFLFVGLSLGFLLAACASSEERKPVEEYMPKSGEISGWVEDTSLGGQGVETAFDEATGLALVNGHIHLFIQAGWNALALEYYQNNEKTIQLVIYEMTNKNAAETIYDHQSIKGFHEWTDLTLGDQSRIVEEIETEVYYLHAIKKNYFVDIPVADTGMDQPGEQMAIDFLSAVLDKLP